MVTSVMKKNKGGKGDQVGVGLAIIEHLLYARLSNKHVPYMMK